MVSFLSVISMWLLLFQPKNQEVQIWVIFWFFKSKFPAYWCPKPFMFKKFVIISIYFHSFTFNLEERYGVLLMEQKWAGFLRGSDRISWPWSWFFTLIVFINLALYFKIILCFMAFLLNLKKMKDAEKFFLWFYCVQLSTL